MRREEIDVIERSLSAEVLAGYYDKYATRFHGDYPHPRDGGEKFIDGLYEVLKTIGDGRIHDETVIYVPTSKAAQKDPLKARYVITVSKKKNRRIFAIRLFYAKTQELESISTIEKGNIVWSPDNMHNTRHPDRTKYYLGFIYMIAVH